MTDKKQNTVDLSWKRYLLPPIHPEGVKILLVFIGVSFVIGLFLPFLGWIGALLCVFCYYFFRNPDRVTPLGESLVISPADGIVSNIKEMVPPAELDLGEEPLLRISIFMSVFNVHVNRAPVGGIVHKMKYRPGKFVNISDKDSEDNERQEISILMPSGQKIGCIQIAGLVARRIYCPLKEGDKLEAGQRFGMIRFGSRLDVFLPKGVEPKVVLGQIMVAGETVLADLKAEQKKAEGAVK
jgi:phosphatidylserine decarboxylase